MADNSLAQIASRIDDFIGKDQHQLPLENWHPDLSGDMDLVITKNGEWIHEKRPITRSGLIRIFASILRREGHDFFLVTPVEKWRIRVEDSPFIAVDFTQIPAQTDDTASPMLAFTTDIGETIIASKQHPIYLSGVDGETPYIGMRHGLFARIDRKTYYRLVNLASDEYHQGKHWLGITSANCFFPLIPSDKL